MKCLGMESRRNSLSLELCKNFSLWLSLCWEDERGGYMLWKNISYFRILFYIHTFIYFYFFKSEMIITFPLVFWEMDIFITFGDVLEPFLWSFCIKSDSILLGRTTGLELSCSSCGERGARRAWLNGLEICGERLWGAGPAAPPEQWEVGIYSGELPR